MIDFVTSPENSAVVGGVSLLVGVVGTVISWIGLGVAIFQLKKVKTQSEETEKAINKFQLKVSGLDVVRECEKAERIIGSVRASVQESDWQQVLIFYHDLMDSFLRLKNFGQFISVGDSEMLDMQSNEIAKICEVIRTRISRGDALIRVSGQDTAIRNFTDIVLRVLSAATKDLRG